MSQAARLRTPPDPRAPAEERGRAARATFADRFILRRLGQGLAGIPLRIRLWDDTAVDAGPEPVAEIVVRTRGVLLGLARNPPVGFGQGYTSGDMEVRGDLVHLLEAIYRHWDATSYARAPERESFLGRRRNTLRGSRENIHHHYDLGNDFYRLWLDEQHALHLRLLPDAGGDARGGAAGEDGPRLPQAAPAARRARGRGGLRLGRAGAAHGAALRRLRARLQHLARADRLRARARGRGRGSPTGSSSSRTTTATSAATYDAFVSVGMLEHVGAENYAALGAVIDRCLGRRRPRPPPLHRPQPAAAR